MNTFKFQLKEEDSLIIVTAKVNDYDLLLALDTGASHTVIDLTALMIAGFVKADVMNTTQLETGKGAIEAEIYEAEDFESLGLSSQNFAICSYDFLANGIFAPIDGVLGLDFFKSKGQKICIDFQKLEINIT